MFKEILRFEWRQQWRAPLFWIVCVAFGLLAFALLTTDAVSIGGSTGNVHRNAPIVVIKLLGVFSVLSMFLATIFVVGAALRDFEQRTDEMIFASGVSLGAYLGGRFVAGYLAALAIMVAVALGLLLGSFMPWLDAARLGPTSFVAYTWAFAVIVIPNLLFIAALLFLLASSTRSMLVTYIGVIVFFVLNTVASALMQDLDNRTLSALLDPFGMEAVGLATRYWSVAQQNHQLPELGGALLANRAIWLGVAIAMLAATWALFRPGREGLRLRRSRKTRTPAMPVAAPVRIDLPKVRQAFGFGAHMRQFLAQVGFHTGSVLRGTPFLIMLALGLANLTAVLMLSGTIYGTTVYPVTHTVLTAIRGSFQWLLLIIISFYAGELIWRERSLRISEVSDAFPTPTWVPMAAKLVALLAVIVIFQAVGALWGIGFQVLNGFTDVQPLLYVQGLLLDSIPFVLIAVLAVFLQVIANNKFLGYLLILLYFASLVTLGMMGLEHHLYDYAGAPAVPYSDMNGFGHFLAPALWFYAYWGWFALGLLVLAALFWVRGTAQVWKDRKREARVRFRRPARIAAALAVTGFVLCGAWIFYNTNIVNDYRTSDDLEQLAADYEKDYAQYKNLPQPRITEVKAEVDIYPYQRRVEIRGHYRLVNKHDTPIEQLHVSLDPDIEIKSLEFAPHDTVSTDTEQGYTIYRLEQPLAPGAAMDFDFTLVMDPQGFKNNRNGSALVYNGTFFNNMQAFPHFGYNEGRELTGRSDRRKYGLDPDAPRMAKLGDQSARANTYIAHDADWIDFETTVSTAGDQIAIAPGMLQRRWTENGRNYFHYKMNQPMLPFFAYLSARYEVARDHWNDVAIEVYYDAQHPYNIERMIEAVKKSLDYYNANFTPYQFQQVRIIEFPNYSNFAQSFANTIPYSESLGFIADLEDPNDIDYVFYVTAHEVAHQWWAHQVIGADMQGSTMLSESLAQYSALMVMEEEYGADKMRRFLKYELDKYLLGRGMETVKELPLAKVENQAYTHYRKGSLVFYALKDYIGEDMLNAMLKDFLEAKGFQMPPYTTSREFMDALSAAAGEKWQDLLDDLFWKITLYDNRALSATAHKLDDGRYEVTLKVHASKTYSDGSGKETDANIDIPIDIGVFGQAADGDEEDETVLYLEKHRLKDGDNTITVIVDETPHEAGIDPYNKLIDRVSGDNRVTVSIE